MKKIKGIYLLSALTITGAAFASGSGLKSVPISTTSTATSEWWNNLYIGVEGGMSMQNGLNVSPDYSNTGYDQDGARIAPNPNSQYFNDIDSTAPFYGLKIGYFIAPEFAMDLAYVHHGDFSYENASDPHLTYVDTAGDVKIDGMYSNTLMINLNIFPKLDLGGFKPFVSAGAGIAFNELGTYYDKSIARNGATPWSYSINSKNVTSFTWQVGIGTNYVFTDHIFLAVGYRFIDLGKFESEDSYWNNLTNTQGIGSTGSTYITPWKCDNVYANEFYISLNYKL